MFGAAAERYRRALELWVDMVRRHAVAVVLAALVVTVWLGHYAAENLELDSSTHGFMAEDLWHVKLWKDLDAALPETTDNIIVVVTGETADLADDAAAAIADRLAQEPNLFTLVYHPGGDQFFRRNGLLYLDLDDLIDLSDRMAEAQGLLAQLARDQSLRGLFSVLGEAVDNLEDEEVPVSSLATAMDAVAANIEAQLAGSFSQLSWQNLMLGDDDEDAEGPHHRVVFTQPMLDYSQLRPVGVAVERVRTIARELALTPENGVLVRMTGNQVLEDDELRSVEIGTQRAGILSLVLVCIILVVGLRSVRLVVAVILTLLFGLVWSTGYATLSVGHLNLISVAFAVLFIGLSVDFGIHFGLRYWEERDSGHDHAEALRIAARGNGGALTLCAVSSAIGFFAFIPTDFLGIAELGVIAGGSMFIALFANLTLLPAFLTLLRPSGRTIIKGSFGTGLLERFVQRYSRVIPIVAFVCAGASLFAVPYARFDPDPLNLKDPKAESMVVLRALTRDEGRPPYVISILKPDLAVAGEVADKLDPLPVVDEAITLQSYVPEGQAEKFEVIDETAFFMLPVFDELGTEPPPTAVQNRTAIEDLQPKLKTLVASATAGELAGPASRLADALAKFQSETQGSEAAMDELKARLLGALPGRLQRLNEALSVEEEVTLDGLPERLRARYMAVDGRARVEVFPEEDVSEQAALERFVAAVSALEPDSTDDAVTMVKAGDVVAGATIEASILAIAGIMILLVVLLGSAGQTLLIMVPLGLAALLTIAATVVLQLPFNFANVIVLPLMLGLGVDNGIHLVMRYRGELGSNHSVLQTSTPRAVLVSALTTMVSFGSLAVSPHVGTASMGKLLLISIGFVLISTLVVLPALLGAPKPAPKPAE